MTHDEKQDAGREPKQAPSGRRKVVRQTVAVVSGYYALKRTAGVFKNALRGLASIKSALTTPELDEPTRHKLRSIHKGEEDGEESRYTVYSRPKNTIFHGDDFGECLRAAYTEQQITKMEHDARTMRRIHAYGAAIVYLAAILMCLKMRSAVPLFSIFPAITLLAFALRRGCYEETLKQRKLIPYQDYLAQRGLFGLWK